MDKKAALPSHTTDVDMDSAWDNAVHERRVKSPADRDYYSQIYAYLDPEGNPDRKSAYSFIHHMVSADGEPGAANMRALSTGIATLNGGRAGTVLRGRDRERVYAHLANHYADADREAPALLPEREIRSMINFIETKSDNAFSVGSQVSWIDEDGSGIGSIISIDEEKEEFLVREWKYDSEIEEPYPTENIILLTSDGIEGKAFINLVPDMAKEVTDGSLVSWQTSDGPYYGDVLTIQKSGELRGEPQGMTLEATEERPVALVRVWMWDEDEWIPTNTNVVAYDDMLMTIDSLPNNPMGEDVEMEDENSPVVSEDSGVKSSEFITSVVERVLAELGVKIDPPAGFSNKPAEEVAEVAAEEPAAEETAAEAPAEVANEEATPEAPVETEVTAEAESDVEPAAEVSATEDAAADAPAAEAEQKSSLTLDDLREFQDLLKML